MAAIQLARSASPPSRPRWVLIFALVVMLVTSLPYLLGFALQGDSQRFTGFLFGVEDGNSYIAKMLSGSAGAWTFKTPYTTLPQSGFGMFLPYLLLGKLAAPPGLHEQLVVLYHLFRALAGVLMIFASYDFLAFFIPSEALRRFGLILITLGGGLGWILVAAGQGQWLGSLPLEFYSPETFGFLSLFGLPHLAAGRALLLWALLEYLKLMGSRDALQQPGKTALKLSLLWFGAGLFQPLAMLVIGYVIAIHLAGIAIWQLGQKASSRAVDWSAWKRTARLAAAAGVLPAVFVVYNAWISLGDPFGKAWTAQNIITSPHPAHYLLAFGLLMPYAWLGGRYLLRLDAWKGWLPVAWALSLPLLAYLPVNLQRRLPEGEWVVWVLLAVAGLQGAAQSRSVRSKAAPLLLLFPSTLLLIAGGLVTTLNPAPPVYRPAGETAAFEALQTLAVSDPVILCAYDTGNALPAWAPARVVIGHGPESVDLARLRLEVERFFQASTQNAQRRDLIAQQGVTHIFWGPAERHLGGWDPGTADYLRQVYQAGEYTIYQVLDAPALALSE
ncbi:MAG: hypothetical protein JXB15_05530 [Anaerolineales bacterium]|nr:hypothetical protein [Anaerolineales bacterium]